MSRATMWTILAMAMMALIVTPAAQAGSYNLTVDNCTGGCNPGPPGTSMGTVTTSTVLTGGNNIMTVTVSLVSPLKFVNTGLQETIDFNLVGTPTISLISTTNSNFSLAGTTAGSEHFDGLGNFQYALKLSTSQGAGGAQSSPETFVISCGTSACTETTNANGFFFGVDVYNTSNGNTGPIGTSGGTPTVPEPTSIAFFGTGLLGLGIVLRKRLTASK